MYRYVFVAHGGELEAKAALLAASLRQKLGRDGEIAAAVMEPTEQWGKLSQACRNLFHHIGVRIVPTRNVVDETYPHGNKITAMAAFDEPAIFLDSDMMMLRPFLTHYTLHAVDAALKTADANTFVRNGGAWAPAYRLFGLPLPSRTHVATRTGERMRPYFNAGFVYVKDGRCFSECWADTARRLDEDPSIMGKRPWLDQVALPIALARLGWTAGEASTMLNYPLHLQRLPHELPYIVHYHYPRILYQHERLKRDVLFYMRRHRNLREVLALYPDWGPFLEAAAEAAGAGAV